MTAPLDTDDTIAAIATPPGAGGIGVIRISGARAAKVVGAVVGRSPDAMQDRVLERAIATDASGARLDEVLFVLMRGPRSFTGEDVAEIHGHGGPANMSRLLRAVVAAGARHALAGEFSRRAFENGRMDLTQAEAILAVIEASTERALRTAQSQLSGGLGEAVESLRKRGAALLAEVEASIDFSDGEHPFSTGAKLAEQTRQLASDVAALTATFALGRAIREGVDVAIVGPPNAGKSSLFNALLQRERAIVDDSPGTTRDFVEHSVVWAGVQITLVDTAGDRDAEAGPERRGIELGRARAGESEIRVVLVPGGGSARVPDRVRARDIVVASKSDLGAVTGTMIATSALTGEGLDELRARILELATAGEAESDDSLVVTSERQRALLEASATHYQRAAELSAKDQTPEIVAVELRDGTDSLARVVGGDVAEEMLDALFARFCIGK